MKIQKCIVSCIAIFGIIFAMALPASADNTKYDHNKICIYCLGKDAFSSREGLVTPMQRTLYLYKTKLPPTYIYAM